MKDIIGKVSSKVSETKDGLLNHLDKIADISDAVRDRSAEYLNQIIESAPELAVAGFEMGQISLCMGLPPSAAIKLLPTGEATEESFAEAIQNASGRPLVQAMLKALRASEKFRSQVKLGQFRVDAIEVSLGLTPSVTLQLLPKGN